MCFASEPVLWAQVKPLLDNLGASVREAAASAEVVAAPLPAEGPLDDPVIIGVPVGVE